MMLNKKTTLCFLMMTLSLMVYAEPAVKKSSSGICHDSSSSFYSKTKKYEVYHSLQECISSGGRLPKKHSQNKPVHADGQFSKLYDRKQWPHWIDTDRDCQNTRAELLISLSSAPVTYRTSKQCSVVKGSWFCPFSAKTWTVASDVDIDHIVPLKWANGHGGSFWTKEKKKAFANDTQNLLVVEDNLNQSKSAQGPDEWMPPNQEYRCEYVIRFDAIVNKYGLQYTSSEKRIINRMMKNCDS